MSFVWLLTHRTVAGWVDVSYTSHSSNGHDNGLVIQVDNEIVKCFEAPLFLKQKQEKPGKQWTSRCVNQDHQILSVNWPAATVYH
jgi:hypothetical protein